MLDLHFYTVARSVRLAILTGSLMIGALACGPALAQVITLPPGLSTKTQLSTEENAQVDEFVAARRERLLGSDLEAMRSARREVLEPLFSDSVSVSFRLRLGSALVPIIRELAASNDETRQINAVRMAGDVGTQPCVEILTGQLGNPKATVRLAAAAGIHRALESLSRQAPAMQVGGAQTLVNAVADRLKAEDDPFAMDPMVRALATAVSIAPGEFAEVRALALTRLSQTVGEKARGLTASNLRPGVMDSFVRAGAAVRDALTGQGGKAVPQAAVRDAAGFGGDLLAAAKRVLKDNAYPTITRDDDEAVQAAKTARRAELVQLVSVAEAVVFYARSASETTAPTATKLADLLRPARTADDARFAEDALGIIGPQGVLTRAPYSLPADRFAK